MNGYARDYHYIDFEKSVFAFKNNLEQTTRSVKVKTPEGLEAAVASAQYPEYMWIEKIILIENVSDNLVLIDRAKGYKYYFSEALKHEIQAAGCTGIWFKPLSYEK